MDFGSFGQGFGGSLGGMMNLRNRMTQPQAPKPAMPSGYEDPMQQMSVAGPGDFNPQGPTTPGTPGILQQLMKMFQRS